MYNLNDLKKDLVELIEICKIELQNRKNGIEGDFSVIQLERAIIPELKELLEYADRGVVYQKYPNKTLNSTRILIDSWSLNPPPEMSVKIMQLQEKFRKLN